MLPQPSEVQIACSSPGRFLGILAVIPRAYCNVTCGKERKAKRLQNCRIVWCALYHLTGCTSELDLTQSGHDQATCLSAVSQSTMYCRVSADHKGNRSGAAFRNAHAVQSVHSTKHDHCWLDRNLQLLPGHVLICHSKGVSGSCLWCSRDSHGLQALMWFHLAFFLMQRRLEKPV